jgi:hypothetical protein
MRASLGDTIKKGIGCGSGVRAVLENRKIVTCFIAFGLMFLLVVSTGTGSMTQTSLSRDSLEETYPDLTVTRFVSPSREDKNASLIIKEAGGITGVSNLTVKFWKGTEQKEELLDKEGTDYYNITHPGAHNIRAYFTAIKLKPGGEVKIRNITGDIVETYDKNRYDFWTPWITGDTILIDYSRADKIKIDRYAWGEVEYKIIDQLNASESKNVSIPSKWNKYDKYDEPRELTVTVDPDNNITELVEGNNSKTGVIYVDLVAEDLYFEQPTADKLCVLVEHNTISATIRNNNETEGIVFPAGGEKLNFDIALEVRHPNGTLAFRHMENSNSENTNFEFPHADKMLYAGEEINVTFIEGKIYPDFVGDKKNYEVSVIADSENDINEGNDFHSDGEENNATSKTVTVYSGSGYMGGDLYNAAHGRIYGDVIYSIGNSRYGHGDVKFTDISSGVNITLARLYVYWVWSEDSSPGMAMVFNDVGVSPKKYFQNPTATKYNKWYGTYAYDVTDIARSGGNNEAKVTIDEGILSGMLLLVVYEDESKPLVEYWITEGAELLMAKNDPYPTGLEFDQCIANASFVGIVNETKVSKAELLTVIPSFAKEMLCAGVTIGDALMFNGRDVGSLRGKSYWDYEGTGCMALTLNRWEDVKEHLDTQDNLAEIQSKGNYMLATNAVLKLTYLPDLTVTLRGPSSAKGGATHKIKATIRNSGEAKAKNFKVWFTATDGTPKDEVRTIKLLEGFSDTTEEFTWTAPDKVGALDLIKIQNVTISVMADSEENVEELEEGNNIATDYISVTITEKPLTLSFDTGSPEKPYPSISGIHEGIILLNNTVTVNTLYTYPCAGTGGHTESVVISNKSGVIATANWTGYTEDYHNITFTQKFTLHAREKYNYTIITGSYPQIIHEQNHTTFNSYISCSSFIDANGREYNDWIPAIRLFHC